MGEFRLQVSSTLAGHICSFLAGFGQANGNGLFSASHTSVRLPASELAMLELVHGAPDFLLSFAAIFPRHDCSLLFRTSFLLPSTRSKSHTINSRKSLENRRCNSCDLLAERLVLM